MVVPYPSTYQLMLFLGMMVLEASNEIKQTQSSKSHQFSLPFDGIERSFLQKTLRVSPLQKSKTWRSQLQFGNSCPWECLDNRRARKQGVWSSIMGLQFVPTFSKPNPTQHGRLDCHLTAVSDLRKLCSSCSVFLGTSQLSLRAEYSWEGWTTSPPARRGRA